MKSKKIFMLSILMVILSLVVAGCGGETESEEQTPVDEKETIVIGEVPYPHEWVPANIIKHVAEELGYPTKMLEGDIGFMFLGLAQGDIHIFPDVWLPTLHKTYADRYEDQIELVGEIYKDVDTGWAVPSYVDIDSIADLKDRA